MERRKSKGSDSKGKGVEGAATKAELPSTSREKISQYRLYKCEWKYGDVFAYQFNSEHAKENGFYKKYVYFVKVGEGTWYPGHIVPEVYFYKRLDSELADITELRDSEFILQFYTPTAYEKNPDMEKKYLLTLLNTSSRVIPKKQLTYLGNMGHVERMANEDLNSFKVSWKNFEEYMIKNFNNWY